MTMQQEHAQEALGVQAGGDVSMEFFKKTHNRWIIKWQLKKWRDSNRKQFGYDPDEIIDFDQNMILIGGVEEMLKLISGNGGVPYNHENTRIFIGSDSTVEAFSQTGILSTGEKKFCKKLDEGYPFVYKNVLYYQASFENDEANFLWNEISITNGDGEKSIALNRKVESLGAKTHGTWTVLIRISIIGGEIYD